jgi:hypothetical protein
MLMSAKKICRFHVGFDILKIIISFQFATMLLISYCRRIYAQTMKAFFNQAACINVYKKNSCL